MLRAATAGLATRLSKCDSATRAVFESAKRLGDPLQLQGVTGAGTLPREIPVVFHRIETHKPEVEDIEVAIAINIVDGRDVCLIYFQVDVSAETLGEYGVSVIVRPPAQGPVSPGGIDEGTNAEGITGENIFPAIAVKVTQQQPRADAGRKLQLVGGIVFIFSSPENEGAHLIGSAVVDHQIGLCVSVQIQGIVLGSIQPTAPGHGERAFGTGYRNALVVLKGKLRLRR